MTNLIYDATAWTQQQRNETVAVVVALLWNGGVSPISNAGVVAAGTGTGTVTVTVVNPSSDPTSRLTQASVEAQWAAMKAVIDAAVAADVAEAAARQTELSSSPLANATLARIDTYIDNAFAAASTAAQIKATAVAVLKKLARYMRARGV